MKKTILLTGIIFLTSSLLPLSQASRNAYHSYLINKQKESRNYRNFTEGRQSTVNKYARKKRKNIRANSKNVRRVFYRRTARPLVGRRAEEQNRTLRPSTNTKFKKIPRSTKKPLVHAGEFRISKSRNNRLKTYENTHFSLQIPQRLQVTDSQNHIFADTSSDFTLKITAIKSVSCSQKSGFEACAVNLSKVENAKLAAGKKFLLTSRVNRRARKFDTILNDPRAKHPILMESFTANRAGKSVMMNRYFVQNSDQSVYLLETQSSLSYMKSNIAWSKQIFDSFRVYPQE